MKERESTIPPFSADGYLPEGLHVCSEPELTFRFGAATGRRRRLIVRVRRWIELSRSVGALRLLIDGSFVTAKPEPNDVDAVVLLPDDFDARIELGEGAALELEEMLISRSPEEIFAAEDDADFSDWIEFFSRTRESDGRRKGLVEVEL
jgi:hypothetical protein